jgi:hypothetical protein
MSSWRALLRGDPLPWLLEKRDPAVRAMTLRNVLDRSARDAELREAQARAMTSPPLSTILKRQRTEGRWNDGGMYGPKYTGSHWSMLLLAEYGAEGSDPRMRRGARRILEDLAADEGGMGWATNRDHGVSCFFGNVVRYVSAAGYGADPRLEPIVQRLVRDAKNFDAACYINDEQPCAWGYARLVWGLAALPEGARTREVERALRRGVEFLLTFKPDRRNDPAQPYGMSYLWRQASFPLFYQADVLFVLRALDAAGAIDDSRAQSSIAWLLSRQDERGRWGGRAPYAHRMPSKIDSSKWVTLQAITLLKHAFPGAD